MNNLSWKMIFLFYGSSALENFKKLKLFYDNVKARIKLSINFSIQREKDISKIMSDIYCMTNEKGLNEEREDIDLTGLQNVEGNIVANSFSSNGNINISGSLDAYYISIQGLLTTTSIYSKELKLNGNLTVLENAEVDEKVQANGLITVYNNLTSNKVEIKGSISINNLACESFEFEMQDNSEITILQCSISQIRKQPEKEGKLTSDKINGKEMYIEYSLVDYIECENLEIGPGCRINTAKVKTWSMDSSSSINNIIEWDVS